MTDAARFILAHFALEPVPAVPEIRLYRARPNTRLARLLQPGSPPPYWAYPWAGGVVLARFVLDRPALVRGRRVLDLGAGSGLVAIAAALAGAATVTAAETDPLGLAAIEINAAENGVAVTKLGTDLTRGGSVEFDTILVGDLFYEAALATRVTAYLDRCVAAGCSVFVGDPGRAHLPHARLRMLAAYEVPDFGGNGAAGAGASSAVYAFEAASVSGDDGARAEGSASRAA